MIIKEMYINSFIHFNFEEADWKIVEDKRKWAHNQRNEGDAGGEEEQWGGKW